MRNLVLGRHCLLALGAAGLAIAAPVQAQTLDDLDQLSDLSTNEGTGIAAAQELANQGALLEALAMLERVMAAYPRSADARVLHAYYLCAIDDQQGGNVEIDVMEDDDFDDDALAELRERCAGAASEFAVAQSEPALKDESAPVSTGDGKKE